WHWTTMRIVDRFSNSWLTAPVPKLDAVESQAPYPANDSRENDRREEYIRLRGNMPVVETRPSLVPGQGYEVRFWITAHSSPRFKQKPRDIPTSVTWSAGDQFPIKTITAAN